MGKQAGGGGGGWASAIYHTIRVARPRVSVVRGGVIVGESTVGYAGEGGGQMFRFRGVDLSTARRRTGRPSILISTDSSAVANFSTRDAWGARARGGRHGRAIDSRNELDLPRRD